MYDKIKYVVLVVIAIAAIVLAISQFPGLSRDSRPQEPDVAFFKVDVVCPEKVWTIEIEGKAGDTQTGEDDKGNTTTYDIKNQSGTGSANLDCTKNSGKGACLVSGNASCTVKD